MTSPRDPFTLPGDEPPQGEKLQKFLSAAGVASRRHAEVLIGQGRVTVNGSVATLGMRVVEGDRVRVNGVEVGPQAPRLFVLNKPVKVVTTLEDPQGRATVAALVPDDVRVYPVGRLDYDTAGLLLMTNDGELAHRLMHPSFGVDKTYRALVEGNVAAGDVRRLAEGVDIGDGDGVTSPAKVRVVAAHGERTILEIVIHEGKNRQVRRMCDAVGHPVVELVRVAYGPLALGGLAPGAHRSLTDAEVRRLRKAAGLAPPRHDRGRGGSGAGRGSGEEAVDADGERDAEHGGGNDEQARPRGGGATRPGARGARVRGGRGGGSGGSAPGRRRGR